MDWFFITGGILVFAVSTAMYYGAGNIIVGWLTQNYTSSSVKVYRKAQLPGAFIFGTGAIIAGIWTEGICSWIGWILLAIGFALSIAEGRVLQPKPDVPDHPTYNNHL